MRLLGLPDAYEYLTVEFPKRQRLMADFVIRLKDGRIVHIELQSKNDPEMEFRCLDYWTVIAKQWPGVEIVQVVVYMGDAPLRMKSGIQRGGLDYKFAIVDLNTVPASAFLSSVSDSERALAALCQTDDVRGTIEAILGSWKHLSPKDLREKIDSLSVLSQLKKRDRMVKEVAADMPIEIDIRENAFYQWGVQEATPVAEARGEARGEAKLLARGLESRFGPLSDSILSRIAAADVETIERWFDRLYSASSLDSVFAD